MGGTWITKPIVSCTDVTVAASFAHLPALKTLYCRNTSIGDAALASLHPVVRELDISYRTSVTVGASFAHLPALEVLNCSITQVGDAALASLHSRVHTLCVNSCSNVTDTTSFAHLPALTMLKCLDTCVGASAIASLPPTLCALFMGTFYPIMSATPVSFTHLTALTTFTYYGTTIDDRARATLHATCKVVRF